jgi:4,5-dihydroxyphthalate decarboxylase
VNDLTCVVAVGDYDHTRDLVCGRVRASGLVAEFVVVETPEELFSRFLEGGEFVAAEMSMALTAALCSQRDDRFVAIPVFPARCFRHGAIYVRSDGPVTPEDLAGVRIGVPAWAQSAGVYVRGLLASRYGLDLTGMRWVQAGVDEPGRRELVALDYGPFDVTPAPSRTLDEMLLAGDVDAVISARPPASIERGDPQVRQLFADPYSEEVSWVQETGIFPIMHLVALRRDAIERCPSLPTALTAAFETAKRQSLSRAAAATVPGVPLPWAAHHARAARDLLGDDWWPYGLQANRPTVDAFLSWAAEQNVTARRLTADELFPSDVFER